MNWVLAYQTSDLFVFEQVKLLLDANDIALNERNTVSSMYNNFGSYEIYVTSESEITAKKIIQDAIG
jgi:hypothetical protein